MNKNKVNKAFSYGLMLIFIGILFHIIEFTPRTSFSLFIIQFAIAFGICYYLLKVKISLKTILILGTLTRLALIFSTPELSNDFYRFIWDGELLLQGINPYNFTPNELISYGQFLSNDYYLSLYHGMGELSQSNYSCYPVFNQFIFAFSSMFSDSIFINTILMKSFIILADIGTLWIGVKVLKILNLPVEKIGWYFLNPLIILEFSGNLHFEGVMIFFILGFIYFILKNNWLLSGLSLGLAIQIKLIPLMFIPFVYKKLKWRKALGFTAIVLIVVLLFSQLLINPENIDHYLASLKLYFKSFQFNASIFSWVNIPFSTKFGWDATQIVGPILGKIAFGFIILLALFKSVRHVKDIFIGLLFSLTIYYAFATTVHPWYISLILIFSLFTNYKFGILWSGLITVSYLTYSTPDFNENLWLNTIIYIIVYGFMIYEVYKNWNKNTISLQLRTFFSHSNKDN